MSNYPDGFTFARYDAAQGRDDNDSDERGFLSDTINKHAWPLVEALRSLATSDRGLNMDCAALAAELEKRITAIKQRGGF